MNTQQPTPQQPNIGAAIGKWTAYDYHPHKRSWIWIAIFALIIFGIGGYSLYTGEYITAISFFLVACIYFWIHRNGDKVHEVVVFEKGIFIDKSFLPLANIAGYWFVYNESASILQLELKKKGTPTISLQMGSYTPTVFREMFEELDIPELEDRKESLLDLWIRALKL